MGKVKQSNDQKSRQIKTLLSEKGKAPSKYDQFPTAIPYPTVHSGGIKAVLMQQDDCNSDLLAAATIPANPPKKRLEYQKHKFVRIKSSGFGFQWSN